MDNPEQNKALVARLYEAAHRRDWDAVAVLVSADYVFHEPGSLPYGGRYFGPQGVKAVSARVLGNTWAESSFQLETVTAAANWVYAHTHMHAVGKTGKSFSFPVLEIHRFQDGALVESFAFYWDTARALEVFNG